MLYKPLTNTDVRQGRNTIKKFPFSKHSAIVINVTITTL